MMLMMPSTMICAVVVHDCHDEKRAPWWSDKAAVESAPVNSHKKLGFDSTDVMQAVPQCQMPLLTEIECRDSTIEGGNRVSYSSRTKDPMNKSRLKIWLFFGRCDCDVRRARHESKIFECSTFQCPQSEVQP